MARISTQQIKESMMASQDVAEVETMEQGFEEILGNNEETTEDQIVDDATINLEAAEPINEDDEDHDPSGVLNPNRFLVTSRTIENIVIENLQYIEQIKDPIDATDAARPIAIRTPQGAFVIEGRNFITEAIESGETSISCEVDTIEEHNVTELCLRKAGIRSQSRGGRARFAELVRNAKKLEQQLISENEELKVFGHGGCRFGEGFSGDRINDTRTILELRLSKSRNTVNNYLNFAEYVSDEVMEILVSNNKDKKFFEDVGRLKSKLRQRLQEEEKTQDEITAEISTLIRQYAEDGFPEPVRVQLQPNQNPPHEDPPENEEDEFTEVNDAEDIIPEVEQIQEDPIINIKRSTLAVSSRLSQRIEATNDLTCLYNAVIEEIRELNAIATQIAVMTNSGNREEREAA